MRADAGSAQPQCVNRPRLLFEVCSKYYAARFLRYPSGCGRSTNIVNKAPNLWEIDWIPVQMRTAGLIVSRRCWRVRWHVPCISPLVQQISRETRGRDETTHYDPCRTPWTQQRRDPRCPEMCRHDCAAILCLLG